MATWKLSPQYKKSAVERQFWYNDGKVIIREEGFRWATFVVDSDAPPLNDDDLKNEDGYELSCIDNDECWEMVDMIDGCWSDTEAGRNCTEEDLAAFEEAWEENYYEGVEALGWSQDDTEYFYYGPLELTNEDTGEVFKGEPDNPMQRIDPDASITKAEIEEMSEESEQDDNPYTEWYPASINPVRVGTYQVLDNNQEVAWPFQSNILAGTWDGEKWDISVSTTVVKWRGLTKESK